MLGPPKICTATVYSKVQHITHSTRKDPEQVQTNPLHSTYICDIPNNRNLFDIVLRRTGSWGPINGGNCTHLRYMLLLHITFRPPRRTHYVKPHASFEGPRVKEHKSTPTKHIESHTPLRKGISFKTIHKNAL